MKRLILILLFSVAAIAQERVQERVIPAELTYDAAKPLEVKVLRTSSRGAIQIEELEYTSPCGGPVPAYLVTPRNGRRNAGIVFAHWGVGDRHTFLEEAIELASLGAVSLLVDAPIVRPAPWGKRDRAQYDAAIAQFVVDLRRGTDLLIAREDVDRERLAFIGLSMGSHAGGILAGVDRRFAAFVLMGGTARFSEYARAKGMAPLDARHFIGHAAPARVFLQYTIDDEYVPLAEAHAYFAAASDPKIMKWYDGGHEISERARRDRAEWLRTVIGIDDLSPANDERIAFPARRGAEVHELPAGEVTKLNAVLQIPGMEHVPVRRDVTFKVAGERALKLDVYYPFALEPQQKVPAVIIVAGQAHPLYMREMRTFGPITSAAQLVAASARRAAIVYDVRSSASGAEASQRFTFIDEVRKDLAELIAYVRANADELQVDGESIAIWSRSGGTTYGSAVAYDPAMRIKAHVAFYPELDVHSMFPLLEQKVPPTLVVTSGEVAAAHLQRLQKFASRGTIEHRHLEKSQHAFDLFDDTEQSRAALRQALQFLNTQLPLR